VSCEQPVGTKVNVGVAVYEDDLSSGKTLDEYWLEQPMRGLLKVAQSTSIPFDQLILMILRLAQYEFGMWLLLPTR
jgi:hypothetical protein